MQYIILCCETYDITLGLSCVTLIFNKIIKMNFFDFSKETQVVDEWFENKFSLFLKF